MLGALIGAGASLLGGALSSKAAKKQQRSQQAFDAANFAESLEHQNFWNQANLDFATRQFESGIQTRVKDARAAGLHPLFALGGATSGGSPSFTTGGHPSRSFSSQTGSALGRGISAAGQGVANALRNQPLMQAELAERKARTELLQSQTLNNLKRAEQEANQRRPTEQPWDDQGVAILRPLPEGRLRGRDSRDPKPSQRPRRVTPTTSAPAYMTLVRPDGTKMRVYDKEAQADEVNQAWIMQQELERFFRKTIPQLWKDFRYNRRPSTRRRNSPRAWR